MSLAQIVSFVTVAETRSVSRASAQLRVAQLPEGEVFLEHARRILADVEAAKTSLRKR